MSILINHKLAHQCETTIALNRVEFAVTEKKLNPNSDSYSQKIGSGYAIFAGIDSPLSRACALGFDDGFSDSQIIELENFYHSKNCPIVVEVSQLANMNLTHKLLQKGFTITDYTNILALKITPEVTRENNLTHQIKNVDEDDIDIFARTTTQGFLGKDEQSDISTYNLEVIQKQFDEVSRIFYHQSNSACFLTYEGNIPVGAGGLFFSKNQALFVGTSTLPEYRFKGIHTELIRERLKYAFSKNKDLAFTVTFPASISQHNLEKLGFQVLYGRVSFRKE